MKQQWPVRFTEGSDIPALFHKTKHHDSILDLNYDCKFCGLTAPLKRIRFYERTVSLIEGGNPRHFSVFNIHTLQRIFLVP